MTQTKRNSSGFPYVDPNTEGLPFTANYDHIKIDTYLKGKL